MATPSITPGTAPTTAAPFSEISARNLGPVRRYFARHPGVMDVVVMVVFAIGPTVEAISVPERRNALVLLLVAAGTAVLAWRRREPVWVAAAMGLLAVLAVATTGSITGFDLGIGLVVYAVAASRPSRTAWTTAGVLGFVALVAVALFEVAGGDPSDRYVTAGDDELVTDVRVAAATSIVLVTLAAMAIGTSVRTRRLHVADLVERANALARDRDAQAELARAGERARIAREMHDVVAHSLTVMVALSDGATAALERSPDRARTALALLSDTGRTALADMRRVLGVLETDAPLEPQPSSTDLGALVERFRAAGLPVRSTGLSTELPAEPGLQLAVYRIVQESLTNTLRHATGTAGVEVAVRRDAAAVEVEVVDHGPAVPLGDTSGSGRGLIGMQERAAVFGGRITTGPQDGGHGWRVHAVLPIPGTNGDGR